MLELVHPLHTLYAIYLKINQEENIQIGRLGTFTFKAGMYVYVGSAKRNLHARINRHKAINKPLKWHFDYLRPYGEITKIITYESSVGECALAEKLRKQEGGCYPIKGFGSSDCKCTSHLIYFTTVSNSNR